MCHHEVSTTYRTSSAPSKPSVPSRTLVRQISNPNLDRLHSPRTRQQEEALIFKGSGGRAPKRAVAPWMMA